MDNCVLNIVMTVIEIQNVCVWHIRRTNNLDKISPIRSTGEEQPYIKSGETRFRVEEEVEFLVPSSNGYPC